MKTLYIPGWMNALGTYGDPEGLEIWDGGFDLDAELGEYVVVGHSVGAVFALANRARRKEGKMVLVNPLFPRRNLIAWYLRLKATHLKEGKYEKAVHIKGWTKYWSGIMNAWKVLSFDPTELICKIPKDDIIIVAGKNDVFICGKEAVDFIDGFGIELVEVDNAGHKWSQPIKETVDKLLKTRF